MFFFLSDQANDLEMARLSPHIVRVNPKGSNMYFYKREAERGLTPTEEKVI